MKYPTARIINEFRYILTCCLAVLMCGYGGLVQSQIEEIVVTATKRGDASIQDIPLSVQAISGDSLQESGALAFNDVLYP